MYSPEQWNQETRDKDTGLFHSAGIDLVTINVFSWALNQPDEDTYNLQWLDQEMDRFAEAGIGVCLATGTAVHPAWMAENTRMYWQSITVEEKENSEPDIIPVPTARLIENLPGKWLKHLQTAIRIIRH